jgi:hypothetical protein
LTACHVGPAAASEVPLPTKWSLPAVLNMKTASVVTKAGLLYTATNASSMQGHQLARLRTEINRQMSCRESGLLKKFLDEYKVLSGLSIHWLDFSSSGRESRPGGVLQSYKEV